MAAVTRVGDILVFSAHQDTLGASYEAGALKVHVTGFTTGATITLRNSANATIWAHEVTGDGNFAETAVMNLPAGTYLSASGNGSDYTATIYVYPAK